MTLAEREVLRVVRRLHRRDIQAWTQAGWVRPKRTDQGPFFDDIDVARLRLICDLRKEMALPNDAVPMVLSLLDQIHGLRRELRSLAEAIERQPEDTRLSILKALQTSAVSRDERNEGQKERRKR